MPTVNPVVSQWIRQMADADQQVAYYAGQCLQEEVLRCAPADHAALAAALGEALVAAAKPGQSGGARGAASFRLNPFLASASAQAAEPLHPANVRSGLARLLGYLPCPAAVPFLARALTDLDAREMARQSLESNPSGSATGALISALDAADPVFRAGVIHSLSKKHGEKAAAALRNAAGDPLPEIRAAALLGLADFAEPSHDAILEKAARTLPPEERRVAHIARVRLAGTLSAGENRAAAERVWRSILSSDAPEPQKKAARLALQRA